jgi:type IV pilus assembly protein PilX
MNTHPKQRGAVLIISLVLLLILTLLGVAAMRNTTLEEQMAGNMRALHIAEQSTDVALRGAEDWMLDLTVPPIASSNCKTSGSTSIGCLSFDLDGDEDDKLPWWKDRGDSWWASSPEVTSVTVKHVANPAAYVVEERALVPEGQSLALGMSTDLERMTRFYQMTARGVDSSGRSEVITTTTFAAPNF